MIFRMQRYLLLSLSTAPLWGCAATPAVDAERQQQARVASELGDWRRAAGLWYGLYREDPGGPPDVALQTARALFESGDPGSALAVVRDSRRFGADGAELAHVAARSLDALGDREGAIGELRQALVADPERGGWWWTLAQWTWEQGQVRPTWRALERALALGVDGRDVQLLAARVLTRLSEPVRAYDAWCAALAGDVEDVRALVEGARVAVAPALAIERPAGLAQGIAWYARAAALEPQDIEIQRDLGRAARLARNLDLALAAFERASELDPADASLLSDLADLHLARGGNQRARDLLRRALDQESDPEWIAEWHRRLTIIESRIDPEVE